MGDVKAPLNFEPDTALPSTSSNVHQPSSAGGIPGRSNTVPVAEEVADQPQQHLVGSGDLIVAASHPLPSSPGSNSHEDAIGGRPVTPPPYSGPSNAPPPALASQRSLPKGPHRYPGLPLLDYGLYSHVLFTPAPDFTSTRSTASHLSSNVSALVAMVRSMATVPPKPQIWIRGVRPHHHTPDFDVRLNLMNLLVPDDARLRLDYLRCVGTGELAYRGGYKPSTEPDVGDGGLEEWCRRFVEDPAPVKTFMLERVVANLDTNWIEGQIRSLIASTDYKGLVTVTFPVTHAKVIVQNPDRINKFFTGVATLFSGKKRYEVVKAVWPFATAQKGEEGRRCLVQSEETWFREWRDAIKYAVATKRQGWITNEDKLEVIMEGKGKGVSVVDWGY